MTIARVIEGRSTPIISCHVTTAVREAVALLSEHRIGALPVFDTNGIAGIVSERDIIRHLHSLGSSLLDRRVGEVMVPAITIAPSISVLEALSLITHRRVRHLPVVQDDKVVGFVSIGDLVKYRLDQIEADAAAMRNYIQSA